jgi:hypothetical protein
MYNCLTKQASPTLIINFCFLKIHLLSFIDWQRISAKSCSPNPPELFPPIFPPRSRRPTTSNAHKQKRNIPSFYSDSKKHQSTPSKIINRRKHDSQDHLAIASSYNLYRDMQNSDIRAFLRTPLISPKSPVFDF